MVTEDIINIYTQSDFKKILSGKTIAHNIVIRDGEIKSLFPVEKINGTIGLCESPIESLSPLKEVLGDFWCSSYNRKPCLKFLGSLQRVEGDANFRYMPIEELGELAYVGGSLSLRDTKINSLGKLEYVGGNLQLPMRLKDKVNLSTIFIGGKVRYWNDALKEFKNSEVISKKSDVPVPYWPHTYIYPDHNIKEESKPIRDYYSYFSSQFDNGVLLDIEGNTNYLFMLIFDLQRKIKDPSLLSDKYELISKGYPIVTGYCQAILIEEYKSNHNFEKAWDIQKKSDSLSLDIVNYYTYYLGDEIFDGNIASKICGTSFLTSFGKSHVTEVLAFFRQSLLSFEKEHGCRFYDVFYDKGKGYKAINGRYSVDYYKQFYRLNEPSFEYYKNIGSDEYHLKRMDDILVVEHAVIEQLRILLIEAEDLYRESIGVPKKGEGWINETALFYKLKDFFKNHVVIQHGRPKWLGKQHLDVYFVDLNIGVEYQGLQHYQPIDYFGGEEGYASNKERDERKKKLCEENGCPLIYVNEGYVFDDVVKSINEAITSSIKKNK